MKHMRVTKSSTDLCYLSKELLKIQVFWDVTPCRLVNSFRRSERFYCRRLQGQAVQTT
jgi:hypothetical protein